MLRSDGALLPPRMLGLFFHVQWTLGHVLFSVDSYLTPVLLRHYVLSITLRRDLGQPLVETKLKF